MIERKLTTTIQLFESQINWLEEKSQKESSKQKRRVSKSEIARNVLQKFIEANANCLENQK